MLVVGERFRSITQARKVAESVIGQTIEPGQSLSKFVEEAIEQSVLLAAKDLIARGGNQNEIYDLLTDLYQRQPILGTRSSTSIELQQYSTTVPLAYLAARLAGIDSQTTVYEPTAGRGALLLSSDPANVFANELDSTRIEDLRSQGYQTTQYDATSYRPDVLVDVVIANPPFGRRRGDKGVDKFNIGTDQTPITTSELDQAISWKALEVMKNNGRGVLIIGSEMGDDKKRQRQYNTVRARKFFLNLYSQYNVTQQFTLDGKLYNRQGGGHPVDVIVVEGRKPQPFLDPKIDKRMLPGADIPQVYTSYEALKERLPEQQNDRSTDERRALYQSPSSLGTNGKRLPTRSLSTAEDDSDPIFGGLSTPSGMESPSDDIKLPSPGADMAGAGMGQMRENVEHGNQSISSNERNRADKGAGSKSAYSGEALRSDQVSSERSIHLGGKRGGDRTGDRPDLRRMADQPDSVVSNRKMASNVESDSNAVSAQVSYQPKSRGMKLDSFVPTNLEAAIQTALSNLELEVGNIDDYVAEALNFPTVGQMHEALAAEQVDGVALALRSLEKGKATLIGDDTGLGKGRQMAAAIKFALETDRTPIFITKDPGLYADIVRDLNDIGVRDVRPFMTNSNQRIPLPNGGVLKTTSDSHQKEMLLMLRAGELSPAYNMVFSTYSQLQTVQGRITDRRLFLESIAPNSTLVLDEAHEASGTSKQWKNNSAPPDRAAFTRELVALADNVFFASATATKRADVLDLYGARMNMADVTSVAAIQSVLIRGGLPLQQVATEMMARDGQYTRRARSCKGVDVGSKVVATNHRDADQFSAVLRAILSFDSAKRDAVAALDQQARQVAKKAGEDNAIGLGGAQSTQFSSIMWSVVGQAGLARKADAVADLAIQSLEQGERPFIGLSNTMGSFIENFAKQEGIKSGDEIDISFQDVLWRYLERSRDITVSTYDGAQEPRRRMTDEELGPVATKQYAEAARLIDQADFRSMPVSPIDWIRYRIESAGYSFGELTGRTVQLDYGENGTAIYQRRDSQQTSKAARIEIIDGFNSGKVDVAVGNRSAATGYSMHASKKFSNQNVRHFIIAQPELDVNNFKQFMGRFHRTGQVQPPRISLIVGDTPDERRPAAVLAKKLTALNANTEAAAKGGLDFRSIPDCINEIGDEVISDMMRDDPELNQSLYSPITVYETNIEPVENAAAKVTGCLPILSIKEQEAFYERFDVEYKAALDRHISMGNNPLEADSLPLDARTLATVEVVPRAENIDSAFAEGITAEVVDVKTLSKPKTQKEVIDDVRQALAMPPVRSLAEHDRREADKRASQLVNTLYSQAEALASRYLEYKRSEYAEQDDNADRVKTNSKLLGERIERQLETLSQIKRFKPGQTVGVKLNLRNGGYELEGAVTDVRMRGQSIEEMASQSGPLKDNPVVPSRWDVVVAIASSEREFIIPLSKMNVRNSVAGSINLFAAKTDRWGMNIYSLFDKNQLGEREVRTVLKGNLLRLADTPYQGQGRIVVATTSSGAVEPMHLLNKGFDLKKELASAPVVLPHASHVGKFFEATSDRGLVKTTDSAVSIKTYGRYFRIQTTKRFKGVYQNESIKAAVGDDFYSLKIKGRRQMVASFPPEKLADVVNALTREIGKPLAAFTEQDIARDIADTPIPKMSWAGTVESFIEQEGLPPSVEAVEDWDRVRQQLDRTLQGSSETETQDKPFIVPSKDEVISLVERGISFVDVQHMAEDERDRQVLIWATDKGYIKAESTQISVQLTTDGESWLSPPVEAKQQPELEEAAQTELLLTDKVPAAPAPQDSSPTEAAPEFPPAIKTPESFKSRHQAERQVAQFIHEAGLAEAVMANNSFHMRIANEGWIPLCVEVLSNGENNQLFLTHYIEQNGDTFHDGEMVFDIREDGYLTLHEIAVRNPMNGGEIREYDRPFAEMFSRNILAQGFAEKALQQRSAAPDKAIQQPSEAGQAPEAVEATPATAESSPDEKVAEAQSTPTLSEDPVVPRSRVEKAHKAAMYLADNSLADRIQSTIADQLSAKIAISSELKQDVDKVLDRARHKQQNSFASSIVQSAKQILDVANQAGLTRLGETTEGKVSALEGQNYSVRSREKENIVELKVICHKTKGLVYAVDGDIVKAENLSVRDKAVLGKYAELSPQQMKEAMRSQSRIATKQVSKNKGISV